MRIVKYFHEEPASLEVLSADEDPDARRAASPASSLEDFLNRPSYFRGYLTATDLERRRFGLTTLPDETLPDFLSLVFGGRPAQTWLRSDGAPRADPRGFVDSPQDVVAIVASDGPVDPSLVAMLDGDDRRRSLPILRRLMDGGAIVGLPEPAHDGIDLSLFASQPIRPSAEAALEAIIANDLRAFSIPHVSARSEEKFYFELYDVERFREWEVG
jgi:hypothetical protein